jgi:hypothetical protein
MKDEMYGKVDEIGAGVCRGSCFPQASKVPGQLESQGMQSVGPATGSLCSELCHLF